MESLAKTFNANATSMVDRANQFYNSQKNAVMDMVKVIQARFPGTNFQIPENMFIALPELKKDAFGVELVNDGNLSFLDDLPKKITLLKKVFEDQQKKVDSELEDYIGKQSEAMASQKDKWQELAGECKNMITNVSKDLAKYNSEGQKAQAEQDAKTAKFCRKYSAISSNPLGACEDAKDLAEDMDQVAARLTNEAIYNTQQFRLACNGYNNTSETEVLEDCSDLTGKDLKTCKRKLDIQLRRAEKNGTSTKPAKKIPLTALCPEPSTSDDEFAKNILKKLFRFYIESPFPISRL